MTEAKKMTNIEVAVGVALSTRNYEKFVTDLTSPPETYNFSSAMVDALRDALRGTGQLALTLDHCKRVMTYGDKFRMPELAVGLVPADVADRLRNQITEKRLGKTGHALALLIHALLGKMTEALELAPVILSLLENDNPDLVNLVEELGDDEFYTKLAHHALQLLIQTGYNNLSADDLQASVGGAYAEIQAEGLSVDPTLFRQDMGAYVRYRNGCKLGGRYKGGVFTAAEALSRDLDNERKLLGEVQ